MSPVTWAFWVLQTALTMAAAIPALIALGYSFACEVFHVPSGFLQIRHPVGLLVFRICLILPLIRHPYLPSLVLLVFKWPPRTCNVGDDALVRLVLLAACESAQ